MWMPQCWCGLTPQLFSDTEYFLDLPAQGKSMTFLTTGGFTHSSLEISLLDADLC